MTPDEIVELQSFGVSTQTNFAAYVTNTFLHGAFALLFAISTVTLITRGLTTWPRWIMLGVTVFTFLMSTLYWTANTADFAISIQEAMIDNTDLPFEQRLLLGIIKSFAPSFITIWTSLILPILSDMVVIWRAWVLFPHQRWVMTLPVLLLLGTTGVSIAFLGIAKDTPGLANAAETNLFNNLLLASIALSLVTNAVATLLIGWKLWMHHGTMKNINTGKRRSYVEKVLVILTEAGVFYCALQLVTLLLNLTAPLPGTPHGYAEQVIYSIYTEFSSMYPTVVVVLVNHHRSFVDTFGLTESPEQNNNISVSVTGPSHLSFARPPTQTTTLEIGHSATTRSTSDVFYEKNGEVGLYGRSATDIA